MPDNTSYTKSGVSHEPSLFYTTSITSKIAHFQTLIQYNTYSLKIDIEQNAQNDVSKSVIFTIEKDKKIKYNMLMLKKGRSLL